MLTKKERQLLGQKVITTMNVEAQGKCIPKGSLGRIIDYAALDGIPKVRFFVENCPEDFVYWYQIKY